ncbi:MAG: hypothetical protein ACREJQ_00205, partial [bacterium]
VSQPSPPTDPNGKKIRTLMVKYYDPVYKAPAGDTAPTNPGVAGDFGCRITPAGGDNRATHPDQQNCRLPSATPPGLICLPTSHCAPPFDTQCTEASPCQQEIELRVEDPPGSGNFFTPLPLKFQVSSIGGDNYTIAAYDPGDACSYKDATDQTNPLTVWRKIYAYSDRMQAGHTDDPDNSQVQAVMNDAFIYFDFKPWSYTDHAMWLRQHDGQVLCDLGPAPGEQYPESLGVVRFVHDKFPSRYPPPYGQNHPPPPKDSVQGFGAHIVALSRSGLPGSGYTGKPFGLQCEVTSPYHDPQHAFIAAETIAHARDIPWMAPDPPLQNLCSSHGIPLGSCIRELELAWKTMVHEYGHTVGLDDDILTHCQIVPGGIEGENSSVMIYGCLEHVDFDGYFSRTEIISRRQTSDFDSG